MQGFFIPLVLIIAVLTIYIVWKLMSPAKTNKRKQRRFKIGKHRNKENTEDDVED